FSHLDSLQTLPPKPDGTEILFGGTNLQVLVNFPKKIGGTAGLELNIQHCWGFTNTYHLKRIMF
ncbi:hypothetical protein, partial [Pedobacter agri]|uniref:hypothetical protein n=1 Tax=Pedobacter agri TaxID=454586 RepID=UPI00292E9A6C